MKKMLSLYPYFAFYLLLAFSSRLIVAKDTVMINKMKQEALSRLTFQNEIDMVENLFNEEYIHPKAFRICQELTFKSQFKECLQAISAKTYTIQDIKECQNSFSKESCLQERGKDYLPPKLKKELELVLKYLKGKNHNLAKEKITALLGQEKKKSTN